MSRRIVLAFVLAAVAAAPCAADGPVQRPAAEAIRDAIVARVGDGADVSVVSVEMAGRTGLFREARPDPAAVLGKPVRFTLLSPSGAALLVSASVRVVADRLVSRHAIERGTVLTAADFVAVRSELVALPLRRLPTAAEAVGARVLRPIGDGATIGAVDIAVRRLIEPGDAVTVVATLGDVEVTAAFVAADGGRAGDVVRVMNPDTKRYLRAKVVKVGVVEVTNER